MNSEETNQVYFQFPHAKTRRTAEDTNRAEARLRDRIGVNTDLDPERAGVSVYAGLGMSPTKKRRWEA